MGLSIGRAGAGCLAVLAAWLIASVPAAAGADGGPVRAVASFSILADLVRQVGGRHVAVTALVGPDADAHGFSPSPGDARILAQADLVVVNGLGLEGWIDRLIRASGTRAPVVVASTGVKTVTGAREGHGHGHAHGAAGPDPHAWQDVANARVYVANIRDALSKADPAHAADFAQAATAYTQGLDDLDRAIRTAVEAIPPENRRIITNHEAFGYFAAAYGLRFIAPQGIAADGEASPRDVAAIIRQIRRERVPAVFLETVSDPRQMERIAKEGGARVGGRIYSDALSVPAGPAATYLDMMRWNLKAFETALAR